MQHERGRQQIVVTAIRARADHGLVEGEPLARDILGQERVAGSKGLGDHRSDFRKDERLVDLVDGVGSRGDPRVRQVGETLGAVPRLRDVVGGEDAVERFGFRHHVGDGVAESDRELLVRVDELDGHALRLLRPPPAQELQHDVLARDPWLEISGEDHAALLCEREVDVPGRPTEAERRRAHAEPHGPVGAVGAAVRVRAGNELARHHEALLGEVEVEDAVAGVRVVRLLQPVEAGELAADRGLAVVVLPAGEDEVIVGDRGLARINRAASGDLVERVDRKRRGPVGRGQEVRVHAQGRSGVQGGVLVHAMRPNDLFGRRHAPGKVRLRPPDLGKGLDRRTELAPAHGEDAAARADLLLFRRQGHGRVALRLRFVRQAARRRIEGERIAVLRVLDRLGALHDVEAEVEGVAPEDVAHAVAADDDELEALFLSDALQSRRAHLARGADGEALARDEEILAAMDAGPEVGHEVSEGPRLPAFIESLEALRDAVGGRRDLVGVDRVEFSAGGLRVPEDERLAADRRGGGPERSGVGGPGARQRVVCGARFQARGLDPVHSHHP